MKKIIYLFFAFLMLGMQSCGSDNDEPNVETFANMKLNVGETANIKSTKTTHEWVSSNKLVASVDGGIVTGVREGFAEVSDGDYKFSVTVSANNNNWKVPCVKWGTPKSQVEALMSSYATIESETENGQLYKSIAEDGTEYETVYAYTDGLLQYSALYVKKEGNSVEKLGNFLAERYVYVTKTSDTSAVLTNVTSDMTISLSTRIQNFQIMILVAFGPLF